MQGALVGGTMATGAFAIFATSLIYTRSGMQAALVGGTMATGAVAVFETSLV
jgi:hypothetical protein